MIILLLIITTITALATGLGIFFRLGYLISLICLVSLFSTFINIRKIEVTIDRRNHVLSVGEVIDKRIRIRNLSLIPKTLLVTTDLTTIPKYTSSYALGLTTKGYRSWRSMDKALQRGVFQMGPAEISTTDLLGLYRARSLHGTTEKIMIYPKINDLGNFQTGSSNLPSEGMARKKSNILSPHASSVREYTYGDSLSRIHWKTTARSGRLMSKEFDVGTSNEIMILNDLDKSIQFGHFDESTTELSITLVASLIKKYSDSNIPVGFLSHGMERYYQAPNIGYSHLDRSMQILASAQAGDNKKLHHVLSDERNIWVSHSSMILITSSTEIEWVGALSELLNLTADITVILIDPFSFGGESDQASVISTLGTVGISPYLIGKGDSFQSAFSQPFLNRVNGNLSEVKSVKST